MQCACIHMTCYISIESNISILMYGLRYRTKTRDINNMLSGTYILTVLYMSLMLFMSLLKLPYYYLYYKRFI